VLEKEVHVYNFDKLERTDKFDTGVNPKGLIAVSAISDCVIAMPSSSNGEIRVELLTQKKQQIIKAHENAIRTFCLNLDGTLLATASEKGTLIRIFDTATGEKIQEVRRGSENATIYSIAFSKDSKLCCTSSDKGTIHIFKIKQNKHNKEEDKDKEDDDKKEKDNRKSSFSFIGLSFLKSEWSFAWFKAPEVPSICCFGDDNQSIIIVTIEGFFIRATFDAVNGGECKQKTLSKFIKSE